MLLWPFSNIAPGAFYVLSIYSWVEFLGHQVWASSALSDWIVHWSHFYTKLTPQALWDSVHHKLAKSAVDSLLYFLMMCIKRYLITVFDSYVPDY